jgi:hypothetical protein
MLHQLVTAYIVFGGLFVNDRAWLRAHIAFNVATIIHWLTNNNRCFMSTEYEDDAGYSVDLVRNLTGMTVSNATGDAVSYTFVIIPAMFSAWKLWKLK